MDYNLNGGVLIIGSLFWQDDLDQTKKDRLRKKWRSDRLIMDKSIKVSVPIRYGRFSGSQEKGNLTYTMVFDSSLPKEKFGKAKAVPFKKSLSNWNELRVEVGALSGAEGTGKDFIKGDQCLVCLLYSFQ
jgi:hypothetical protein